MQDGIKLFRLKPFDICEFAGHIINKKIDNRVITIKKGTKITKNNIVFVFDSEETISLELMVDYCAICGLTVTDKEHMNAMIAEYIEKEYNFKFGDNQ